MNWGMEKETRHQLQYKDVRRNGPRNLQVGRFAVGIEVHSFYVLVTGR